MQKKEVEMGALFDKSDMRTVLQHMPQQIKEAYAIDVPLHIKGEVHNIIVCGMGGSGMSGILLRSFLRQIGSAIPVHVVQDYSIPSFASAQSLLFIVSYSGNTEECISCYRQATRAQWNTICITTGGKLEEYARINKSPCILVPKGLQPRNAIGYVFFPLVRVLEKAGIIDTQEKHIHALCVSMQKNASSIDKAAIDIAQKIHGKIPVIYASMQNDGVAYRWKCELNENAKIPAFYHTFSELNHNELIGFVNYAKLQTPLHILFLKDDYDQKRIQKRMNITRTILKKIAPTLECTEIKIPGTTPLERMFLAIYLGDLVSYHLALLYGTDPTPVDVIEQFKKELGPSI